VFIGRVRDDRRVRWAEGSQACISSAVIGTSVFLLSFALRRVPLFRPSFSLCTADRRHARSSVEAQLDIQGVGKGTMVSRTGSSPARAASSFVAQLIHLNSPMETAVGSELLLDVCTATVPCKVLALQQKIDRRSGKVLEEEPKVLKAGDVAFVQLQPLEEVCVEASAEFPLLGRFAVRLGGQVVAVGMVKSVEHAPFTAVHA
jgi:sulfate adenylyltransferase subunit 1 (EFTu-like GTPase family)